MKGADDDGKISVQVLVSPLPGLAQGDRIELFLNGHPVRHRDNKDFVLANVRQGSQRLRARVVSADGDTIGDSDPVQFCAWKTMEQ